MTELSGSQDTTRHRLRRFFGRDAGLGYLLLLPLLLFVLGMLAYPFLNALYLSLTKILPNLLSNHGIKINRLLGLNLKFAPFKMDSSLSKII